MEIHRLTTEDVARFRAIRLDALRDAPSAFGTTYEAARNWAPELWMKLLSEMVVFVAEVGGDDNKSAIAFYRRCGFKPTGQLSRLPPPRQHLGRHQQIMSL
jgi:hypothetical protein